MQRFLEQAPEGLQPLLLLKALSATCLQRIRTVVLNLERD